MTSKSSGKYGSFKVKILNEETKEYNTFTVNPPSQNQLSYDWRLVLPKKRYFKVKVKDDNEIERDERRSNVKFFKINMAQLPSHLFDRIIPVYNKSDLTHYTAKERIYNYIIYPSPIDDEIRDMVRLLNLSEQRYLNYSECEQLYTYNKLLKDNEIYGWPLLKSQRLVSQYNFTD